MRARQEKKWTSAGDHCVDGLGNISPASDGWSLDGEVIIRSIGNGSSCGINIVSHRRYLWCPAGARMGQSDSKISTSCSLQRASQEGRVRHNEYNRIGERERPGFGGQKAKTFEERIYVQMLPVLAQERQISRRKQSNTNRSLAVVFLTVKYTISAAESKERFSPSVSTKKNSIISNSSQDLDNALS